MSVEAWTTIFVIISFIIYFIYRFFGVSAEGIGTVGMMLNVIVTFVVSRVTPPPPAEIQELIENLRSPEDSPMSLLDIGEEELD